MAKERKFRFIYECANYMRTVIDDDVWMSDEERTNANERIDKAIRYWELGMIMPEEAVKEIANVYR